MNLRPVTLTGKRVRLEPLGTEHAEDLAVAATDDQIWTYLDEPTPWDRSSVDAFIADANRDQERGARIAFAIVDTTIDRAVGSTSYIDIRPNDRGVEIGWTWITPSAWGTGINTEAKYLMLAHAFDEQCAIRVAIKTDQRNVRSQRAIERLGAVYEGVWRNHRILTTGEYRHTVYYSIIESDWNNVKGLLKARIQ
jgi:RimJ/RimL family protein N-acetyltransferase